MVPYHHPEEDVSVHFHHCWCHLGSRHGVIKGMIAAPLLMAVCCSTRVTTVHTIPLCGKKGQMVLYVGKKQLKTFLVFPLWTVDHNSRQLSRICHTPRRICNNGVGFIVRIFLSGHISISTVLLIVEVIICKKAFDKYIWSFLTSILSSAGAEMNQILHLVPWILYFYHFKNASCHHDFWRRNLFFWELNDCRWAFNTSKQCRILCLIFTSKGWSHLCIFTSVHAMWPFCAVLMTFKCSHHIRPILGPNRCQWLLSFWKQLINKIFLETVSHEIGYSESHNSNLSKTFFTK